MIYCVMGAPRSGTSAIAGCLKILGVCMGRTEDLNHEDVVMRDGTMEDRFRAICEREQPWGLLRTNMTKSQMNLKLDSKSLITDQSC